jgi:hypothetical protein
MRNSGEEAAVADPSEPDATGEPWSPFVVTAPVRAAEGGSATPVPPLPRFLVSEALPLYALGLVPPPPELGAHLLYATPLEVALAAASATAQEMAIAPLRLEPDLSLPESEVAAEVHHHPGAFEGSVDTLNEALQLAGEAAASTTTHGEGDVRGDGFINALPTWADLPTTGTAAMSQSHDRGDPSASEPNKWSMAEDHSDAQAGLAALDLTRRGAPMAGQYLPPSLSTGPLPALALLAPGRAVVASPAEWAASAGRDTELGDRAASQPLPSAGRTPRSNWPGFLTGFVMALAIGAGIYVSLI